MRPSPFHPTLDELAALSADELLDGRREDVAAHVRGCARCQEALRFVRRLQGAAETLPAPPLPAAGLQRALAARAAGERRILPVELTPAPEGSRLARLFIPFAAAAAVLVALTIGRAPELAAVDPGGELRLIPAQPRAGDVVEVRYRPAAGSFGGEEALVLRARLRTPTHEMYEDGVPVQVLATMRRGRDGEYAARFTLPDSLVFAALVVEDARAERIDDAGGRLWEILVHGADGHPTFDALTQRMNDMMGRSWEEAYATARLRAERFPEQVRSWRLREFFERALLGDAAADSVAREYRSTLDALIAAAKQRPMLGDDEIGTIFYRQWTIARNSDSPRDSAEASYWWERIRREHPQHQQIVQRLAGDVGRTHWEQPAALLDSLERIHAALAPVSGPGRLLFQVALQAAARVDDHEAYRKWSARAAAGQPDSAVRMARVLAGRVDSRDEGLRALRALLGAPDDILTPVRPLTATASIQARNAADVRRQLLVAHGRALVGTGAVRAGIDTLELALQGVWDPALFTSASSAYLVAGDSARGRALRYRLAVDPRTPLPQADSLRADGIARMGDAAWSALVRDARAEMHAFTLERSVVRGLRGTARLFTSGGDSRTLRELTAGQPAVVIFWSRFCGPALEALPLLQPVAVELLDAGIPVLLVVDEGPSEELSAFLTASGVTMPVYHDTEGSARAAFASFGTPSYYVLDAASRIRFTRADGERQLITQVAALLEEQG